MWRNSINSDLFFSSPPSPPLSVLLRADRLLRNTSERLARVRVRIDKKPMGRIKKKKVLLFLNTLKVARWFILFLSSALRFIDCISQSLYCFFSSRTLSKNARPRAFCYETEIKSLKIVSTFSEIMPLIITSIN